MTLGDRIAQLRRQAGLSQEQLGEQLEVSRQAVSKWESGQTTPELQYILALCRLFQVSSDWLLTGEESARTEPEKASLRCPFCGGKVGEHSKFCPDCGRSLRGGDRYTLLLVSHNDFSWSVACAVQSLSVLPFAKGGALVGEEISQDEAAKIIARAPVVLCRDLTLEQAGQGAALFQGTGGSVQVYPDQAGRTPRELMDSGAAIPLSSLGAGRAPMTFGATVGAVILGIVAAVILLSFL